MYMSRSFDRSLDRQDADGIRDALLKADKHVTDAAKRWRREIEGELKGTEVKIDLKVDKAKAKKEIEAAAKDQTATINADADTAKAKAELDVTARPVTKIKAEVDEDTLRKVEARVARAQGGGGGSGGSRLPFPGNIVPSKVLLPLGAEALGLAPNIVPLMGSIAQAVGHLPARTARRPPLVPLAWRSDR